MGPLMPGGLDRLRLQRNAPLSQLLRFRPTGQLKSLGISPSATSCAAVPSHRAYIRGKIAMMSSRLSARSTSWSATLLVGYLWVAMIHSFIVSCGQTVRVFHHLGRRLLCPALTAAGQSGYSSGTFALSIFSRTHGAPPRIASFSR